RNVAGSGLPWAPRLLPPMPPLLSSSELSGASVQIILTCALELEHRLNCRFLLHTRPRLLPFWLLSHACMEPPRRLPEFQSSCSHACCSVCIIRPILLLEQLWARQPLKRSLVMKGKLHDREA